jgi:molybdopterin synthase sulfur carrier subunit
MLKIVFFAQTRELVGCDGLDLEFSPALADIEAIRSQLAQKTDKWDLALQRDKLLVAVNQEMSSWDVTIKDGDEVAFFPPVTGG